MVIYFYNFKNYARINGMSFCEIKSEYALKHALGEINKTSFGWVQCIF